MPGCAVWKFPLADERTSFAALGNGSVQIEMPTEAKILTVDLDPFGVPSVWALVRPDAERRTRHLRLVMTGETLAGPPEEIGAYVGTWMDEGIVCHLFDRGEVR